MWERYFATRGNAERNALIEHYLPLVHGQAMRLKKKLPECVEQDDLVSDGVFGLTDAIAKFDPARGVRFTTYSLGRISGSMIDGLRDMDWVPRLERRRNPNPTQVGYLSTTIVRSGEKEMSVGDVTEDPTSREELEQIDQRDALRRMLRPLPRSHRAVMLMYYEGNCNMKEIGRAIGMSESRVSQIHSQALAILKANLN